MKAIAKFLILFFCININIIFTICSPDRRWEKNYEPVENWPKNYVFTGISQQCNWYVTTDFTSNMTRGNTIVIKNPPAHILQPDSFFDNNLHTFNYERVECEFNVEAPVNHGLVVTIQQMNFDKECTDFVQFTNRDGSLNKTICNKFGGFIPRSYPDGNYLRELNSKEYNKDSPKSEVLDAEGRIHVKISVTKKNFENLRYLFIVFTAIKRDVSSDNKNDNGKFVLQFEFYCDGIKNWKTAGDEKNCVPKQKGKEKGLPLLVFLIILLFAWIFTVTDANQRRRKKNAIPVQPSATTVNLIDTLSVNLNNNSNDKELPTYEALVSGKSQQVSSTLRY